MHIATTGAGLAAIVLACAAGAATETAFPPLLETYVTQHVRLTPKERASLLDGNPVTKPLDADPAKEVSLFGAVWIASTPDAYVRLMRDIENFERGGPFLVTKRISDPPRPADFAALHLPPEDLAALRTCRVGQCDVKLSEQAIDRIQKAIDWTKPTAASDAEALVRQILYEYVKGYVEGGNERLAVYRDHAQPTFVADEFKSMIERMPEIGEHLPELKAYLLDYPHATIPNSTSFLYWQDAKFGLKPTIHVNHVVIDDRPGAIAVASKLIYASHYFWTALDLRVLVPDAARGQGFWFVNVTRSRSDGLSGFVGKIIRERAQSEARKKLESALRETKDRLEHELIR
jgi:hypothetical protein